eukprot:30915-Eustigmatos_ZCMA.PRE.1
MSDKQIVDVDNPAGAGAGGGSGVFGQQLQNQQLHDRIAHFEAELARHQGQQQPVQPVPHQCSERLEAEAVRARALQIAQEHLQRDRDNSEAGGEREERRRPALEPRKSQKARDEKVAHNKELVAALSTFNKAYADLM